MTENQTAKDENNHDTIQSDDLETVKNTDSETLSQEENVKDSTIIKELENLLDSDETDLKNNYVKQIKSIDKEFLQNFPYQYL